MHTVGMLKKLLTICQSADEDYRQGKNLDAFCIEFGVGKRIGANWRFSDVDKRHIANILRIEGKVDPATPVNHWDGLSRHESLHHGGDEKLTRKRLRNDRVAVKALPSYPLMMGTSQILLPEGACLDIDRHVAARDCRHQSVLLIENWENFELTHATPFLRNVLGNPLVVFRGAPASYKTSAAHKLLTELALPVLAFTDYDPEGIAIAATLPHFAQVLAPSDEVLMTLMKQVNTQHRYTKQIATKPDLLENLIHPELVRVLKVIKAAGKALPQEKLIGLDI